MRLSGSELIFSCRKGHSNRMPNQKTSDWSLWPQPRPYQKRIIIQQADGRFLVYFSRRPWNKKIVRYLAEATRFLARENKAWLKELGTPPRCIKRQFQFPHGNLISMTYFLCLDLSKCLFSAEICARRLSTNRW